MNRSMTLALVARIALGAFIVAAVGPDRAYADPTIIPHPALEQTADVVTKQLGNFGESFVDAGLRARGFQVVDGNVGVNGIDRVAVKRAASGELADIRFIEVKTRQAVPDFDLAVTKNNGPQLSEQWTRTNLGRIVADHPDPNARRLASEVLEQMKARPEIVRRELHGIAVQTNKYMIMSVDDAGRVTGVAAEGRLTSLLKMLSTRGTSEETRAAAIRHLAQFDQLQTAVSRVGATPGGLTKASAQGAEGIVRQAKLPVGKAVAAPRTAVVVQDAKAATHWMTSLAKQPGVLAAGITFAVDEAFTGWDYYQGNISSADFQHQTAQNGIKAAAVGVATQLVYILAPTPHGLVLIGVGIVAYVAADQAIKAYDSAFVPKAPAATELEGIIPVACIAVPTLEDVATGRRQIMPRGK